MKFKNNKCVSISKSEYDDIKFIDSISTCQVTAMENLREYLIKDGKIDPNLDNFTISELVYNLYMAVVYDYKYMKVDD